MWSKCCAFSHCELLAHLEVLLVDQAPYLVLELEEARTHLCLLVARVGDVDVDDSLDAAGTGGHYYDLLREDYGLVDVVGNEEAGLHVALPGLQQLARRPPCP